MEEENKQLLEESKRCKAENERFLADQQKSRSEAQAEQQKYFEKIVMIEQQRDVIKRQVPPYFHPGPLDPEAPSCRSLLFDFFVEKFLTHHDRKDPQNIFSSTTPVRVKPCRK